MQLDKSTNILPDRRQRKKYPPMKDEKKEETNNSATADKRHTDTDIYVVRQRKN